MRIATTAPRITSHPTTVLRVASTPPPERPTARASLPTREPDDPLAATLARAVLARKEASGILSQPARGDLRSALEELQQIDPSAVRVVPGAAAAGLNALAYAQGNDIQIGPRQERILAHEAWHVVQQLQGRVQPTRQL